MKTPLAFIIFKRPQTTEKVFEVIRQAKPSKLFVIADGPRTDRLDEADKCEATRQIISRVDWNCEVLTNYSDINLGCKLRVSSGLDWVFQNVEEAIILEDDCVPHITFFRFCEELLERYRHDERIMSIGGLNVPQRQRQTEDSYHFSRYFRCWGWATWRRAWKYFDPDIKLWTEVLEANLINDLLEDTKAVKNWTRIFQEVYDKRLNTSWAYPWTFACWIQNGLSILPHVNLVTNVGFGEEATNTVHVDSHIRRAHLPLDEINFPLRHPSFVIRDLQADQWLQHNIHDAYSYNFFLRLKNKLRKLLTT